MNTISYTKYCLSLIFAHTNPTNKVRLGSDGSISSGMGPCAVKYPIGFEFGSDRVRGRFRGGPTPSNSTGVARQGLNLLCIFISYSILISSNLSISML
jgi:hypothetical protein